MTVPNQRPLTGELIQFIKSDGTIFDLNSPPSRGILNMTGWGKPPDERHTVSGPYQHGETLVSYRLRPRTISMDVMYPYVSRSEWHEGCSQLLNQMGINNASPNQPVPGVLRWEYFEGTTHKIRCLDVYLNRGLGFTPLDGWRQWTVSEGMEFVAHNPVIYDPTVHTTTISTFVEMLVFDPDTPYLFPFVLGTSFGTATITYAGTWETKPTIAITGPAAETYIENRSTGKKIRLDYVISLGETVTITLNYDNISIVNNLGQDLSDAISDDSDLGEFGLLPYQIIGENNDIYVAILGVGATTTVVFTYYDRYYGK